METSAQTDCLVLTPPSVPRAVIPLWVQPQHDSSPALSDAPFDSVGFWRGGDDPTPISENYWRHDRRLRGLPKPGLDDAGKVTHFGDGGGPNQEQAKHLWDLGLESKANRLGCCGRFGVRAECRNGHAFYRSLRCELRFCRSCGPSVAARLFERHVGLEKIVQPKRGWVLALLDFTVKSTCQLPDAESIRSMNKSVRRVMKKLLGAVKGWGFLWVNEFGFDRVESRHLLRAISRTAENFGSMACGNRVSGCLDSKCARWFPRCSLASLEVRH